LVAGIQVNPTTVEFLAQQRRRMDAKNARVQAWRARNPEKMAEANRARLGKYKEELKAYHQTPEWKEYKLAHNAMRRAKTRQNMPKWADRKAITKIYRNCPPGHHVDHVIPLHGETVSGLHVPENLQYLPAVDNLSKGNKFDPSSSVPSGSIHQPAL
jgi:hypothetical protein